MKLSTGKSVTGKVALPQFGTVPLSDNQGHSKNKSVTGQNPMDHKAKPLSVTLSDSFLLRTASTNTNLMDHSKEVQQNYAATPGMTKVSLPALQNTLIHRLQAS